MAALLTCANSVLRVQIGTVLSLNREPLDSVAEEHARSIKFQDPGNKIIDLAELSVFFRTLRKIRRCFRSAECTSWDCLC
jgi:hypothetical protein